MNTDSNCLQVSWTSAKRQAERIQLQVIVLIALKSTRRYTYYAKRLAQITGEHTPVGLCFQRDFRLR